MDHTLLGPEPAQLVLGGEAAPEAAHVSDDLLERAPHDQVLVGARRRDDDLGAASVREGQTVPLELVWRIGAQHDVGAE